MILLITPPLTQLNTPYPATAYLKGFLNEQQIASEQVDLGLELVLKIFTQEGLETIFDQAKEVIHDCSDNSQRIFMLQEDYLDTVDQVIHFLQNQDSTLAHSICSRKMLPEASRFSPLNEELEWAFGAMGIQDKARYLATLYLEDLGDFIMETITPDFGFSKYAERIGMSATHFAPIHEALQEEEHILDQWLCTLLHEKIEKYQPEVVALSVPFPGNLYGALKCGQYLKKHFPSIQIVMGGGYPNTELRDLEDPQVFDYVDYITLDDGEGPILSLMKYLSGDVDQEHLQRTYLKKDGKVQYINGKSKLHFSHAEVGTPDYKGLPLSSYLSVIDVMNPMHRLWNDGRWNKITVAHGCYWKKCSFCDISLDYIGRYDGVSAVQLVDRIEQIVQETGQSGFHLVDEAAPPAALREMSLEIIKRGLKITWWGNIRFEKIFTPDLCRLMSEAGCIAVSGGIEVASDRLLKMMAKGVTVGQVAKVTKSFTEADIMVHAYLMYGFPTQTSQETIDSLEVVRQLFENNCIQSGYWHRFSMTAHAPIGLEPEKFGVVKVGPEFGGFAWNDLQHEDPTGTNHEAFSEGLKKAIFNYMHGLELDRPVETWFDEEFPPTSHAPYHLAEALLEEDHEPEKLHKRLVWLGRVPLVDEFSEVIDGEEVDFCQWVFINKSQEIELTCEAEIADWLIPYFDQIGIHAMEKITLKDLKNSYEATFAEPVETLWNSEVWNDLKAYGLLIV